jgi:hypothetical protein
MEFFNKIIRDGNTLETRDTQIISFTPEGYEMLIPEDEGNAHYQEYLTWVADGNEPAIVYNDSEYRNKHYPEESETGL